MKLILCFFSSLILIGGESDLAQGLAWLEEGKLDKAQTFLEKQAEVNIPGALLHLGRVHMAREDWTTAIKTLKQAATAQPENADVRYWLGIANLQKLQVTKSMMQKGMLSGRVMENLKAAIDLNPDHLEARTSLAYYYLNAPPIAGGSKRAAMEQAQEIVSRNPSRGRLLKATIHRQNQEYEAALVEYQAHLNARPDDANAWYQMGITFQVAKQFGEARKAFMTAMKQDGGHLASLYQIGRTAAFSGEELSQGAEALEKYIQQEIPAGLPDKGSAYWRLGMIHEKQGNQSQAKASYQKAIELNPENQDFRKSLAALEQ